MTALPPSTSRYWLSYALRIVLLVAVFALLVLVNQRYLFHTELYEGGAPAANTLSVLRAQHAEELHGGPDSGGNFHQPGPALFYGEALGEAAFYRTWHLTPTPYNAQVMAVMLLLTSLFAAGISAAARWVRGGVFVALALTFAALHFGAVGGRFLVVTTGSAYIVPLIFFGLLVSAASVAAGQGEDLPLLALTGGFLLHLHVAQPLFVGPMFLLAYSGLAWSCRQRRNPGLVTAPTPTVSLAKEGDVPANPVSTARTSALPWRVYRMTHVLAAFTAAVFGLPIVVDALFPHGNFRHILAFLRQSPDGGHSWLASLTYFLHFAVYQPSDPGTGFFADDTTQMDLPGFIARHPEMTFLWLAALLSPLLPSAARAWRGKDPVLLGTATAAVPTGYAAPAGRWRFLGWLWIVWLVSLGLTLVWGHFQPGPMFYANAWFNYAIWYVLALLAAGSLADALDTLTSRSERPLLWKGSVVALCAAGTFFALSQHADRFRAGDANDEAHRAQRQTVANLLATESAGTPHAKLLVFPHDAWESATGVAALLARWGRPVYVLPEWANLFGEKDVLPEWERVFNQPDDTNPDFEVWHFVPLSQLAGVPSTGPLLGNYALVPGGLPIDPAKAPAITWTGENPNFRAYCGKGWNTFEDNSDFTTTVEQHAVLQFRAVPIPSTADVRITFDFKPYLPAGKRDFQRMTVHYNGHDLGTFQVNAAETTGPQVAVPAAVWNRYSSGLLTLHFPDAISPQAAGEGGDTRRLGFAAHQISFGLLLRVEAPAAPPPKIPAPTPGPAEAPEPAPVAPPETMPEPPAPSVTPEPSAPPEPAPVMRVSPDAPPSSPAESEDKPSPTPGEP